MIAFTKTIGFRLWLVCVAAISIPLGINIVLLNVKQYRITVDSSTSILENNSLFKAHTLTQIAPLNAEALSLFVEVLDLNQKVPKEPDLHLSQEMHRIFDSAYQEISLIQQQPNEEKIVVASNILENVGKNYNDKIHIASNQTRIATLKKSAATQDIFSVMQMNIFNLENNVIQGILYTTYNIEHLLKNFLESHQNYLTVKTALVSKDGIILKASDPELQLQSLHHATKPQYCQIFLEPQTCPAETYPPQYISFKPLKLSAAKNCYAFQINKETYWGCLSPTTHMDFYVLSYCTKKDIFNPLWRRGLAYAAYFFCILLGSYFAFLVAKRLSYPIRQLATTMIRSRSNSCSVYTPDPLGFEINRLGHIFNTMIKNLFEQQSLAQKNYEIKENAQNALQLGEQAQQRLLPLTLPSYPHVEIAKAYIPAITVGGDFFDVFVVGEGDNAKLFLIVADASGKGVYACGFSLFLKNILRTFLTELASIQDAIQRTAELFYESSAKSSMFVTLCVHCYSYTTQTLEYYSCGHLPACFLSPQGEVSFLNHSGMALGFLPTLPNVQPNTIRVAPGSLLVLYSDGITEAYNKYSEMFGEERLQAVVSSLQGQSAEQAQHTLMSELKTFVGDNEQHDDITLLILKIEES